MRTLSVALLGLALLLSACGASAPPEARASLGKAATALKDKKKDDFIAQVLPSQRTGALGLSNEIPVTGVKASTLTAADTLDIQFFAEATEMEVLEDGDSDVTDTGCSIMVMFRFGGDTSAARSITMKKEGDAWFIDLKATLEWWHKVNGADAFTALTVK